MKHLKKLGSVLLALVMVLALAAPAFATTGVNNVPTTGNEGDTTGSIPDTRGTIILKDTKDGQTYDIYQIFMLLEYNRTPGATSVYNYVLSADSPWVDFFRTGAGKDYVELGQVANAQYPVSWKEDAGETAEDVQAFAQAALAFAEAHNIQPAQSKTGTGGDVKVENLVLGYYLVDSTVGTLCSLGTTDNIINVYEKNEEPTNEKTVEEDSTKEYGEKDDADIGQTVNFKSVITAQAGAENYVFHDTMSAGLTFSGTVTVKKGDDTVEANGNYRFIDYTKMTPAEIEELGEDYDDCTFEIEFTEAFCEALAANDIIEITYSAVLNENAVISGANPNESKLTYGENSSTAPSTTETYTWQFDIYKYTSTGEGETATKSPLAGATFSLSKTSGQTVANGAITDAIEFVAAKDEDGKVIANTYMVAPAGTEEDDKITQFTTPTEGTIKLIGLDSDDYYLYEISAPNGYTQLTDPVKVTIDDGGKVYQNVEDITAEGVSNVNRVEVLNQRGSTLPSTGGIGTTIFYIVGGVLVVGAVVLLITKRRASADDE